ncbi:hypothetical protein D9758_005042 [Tetrapyrgos nigripes]|uniref:Cap-specific mRNA (nucleoside-2'-O-)-methyltransferase 1 n=1 Tax=Tetrapyrgos nigripes TaxID=182062 RepID=A0A8H5GW80_9AGAR|nr:hypothetical protein D9758_005042 [Tetrapyrgos nigripes]
MYHASYTPNLGISADGFSISPVLATPLPPLSSLPVDSGSELLPSRRIIDGLNLDRDERGQPVSLSELEAVNSARNRMWKLSDPLIARGAYELEYLLKLKRKGWEDKNLDNHFAKQRHVADTAGPMLNLTWYNKMQKLFGEIDSAARCIPDSGSGSFRFLDLGCCPGGFSAYILKKNSQATGVGVSLPVDQGGHECALEIELLNRFTLHFADLTKYDLRTIRQATMANGNLINIAGTTVDAIQSYLAIENELGACASSNKFDIILLDGHHLRTNTNTIEWEIDQLLISQFVIALSYVRSGGTLVIKQTVFERYMTAKMIRLFDLLCERVETVKPLTMHANRGSFYLVAHGVGRGVEGHRQEEFLTKLKEIWEELTFGGQDGTGRFLNLEDFDFVVTTEELKDSERSGEFLDKLVELGRKVWQGQIKGLEGLFRAENAKHTDRGRRPSRGGRGFWRGGI